MVAKHTAALFQRYVHSVHDALRAVSNGEDLAHELVLLAPEEAELLQRLETVPTPLKAAEANKVAAQIKRANQLFNLEWRTGNTSTIKGWDTLAKAFNYKENTLRVLLSKGKGCFHLKRTNPATGEEDVLTIRRVIEPDNAIAKKRGRPRTRPMTEQEYLAKQGLA